MKYTIITLTNGEFSRVCRSKKTPTIETLERYIVEEVLDDGCLIVNSSISGQSDTCVTYLFIDDFLNEIEVEVHLNETIPVL